MACNLLQTNIMTTQISTPTVSMDNNALAAAGLLAPAPVLPASNRVARGKGFVEVQSFAPTGGASAIKAALKAANPKISSKALCAKVNETLRGERDLREQLGLAYFQANCQAGFVPTHGERGKKASVIRFTLAPEPVKAVEPAPETVESVSAKIAELTAMLAKLQAPK